MYTIQEGKTKPIESVYAIKDKTRKVISNIYSIIKGEVVLVWTAVKDLISGVFSTGSWNNKEGWNNKDAWKNLP
jgi:hypothetical protein